MNVPLFLVMTAQQECLQLPLAEMESTISPPLFSVMRVNMDVLT